MRASPRLLADVEFMQSERVRILSLLAKHQSATLEREGHQVLICADSTVWPGVEVTGLPLLEAVVGRVSLAVFGRVFAHEYQRGTAEAIDAIYEQADRLQAKTIQPSDELAQLMQA